METYNYTGMPLPQWMMLKLMPSVKDANKYTIGQTLTAEQAEELKQIIAKSMEFEISLHSARKDLDIVGTPYRDFIVCYVLLMMATADCDSDWANALWSRLWLVDQLACQRVIEELYNKRHPKRW